MSDNRELAIKLKLQKANALLNEAEVLMQNKFYATVINRLYYGCFHVPKHCCLQKTLHPKRIAVL